MVVYFHVPKETFAYNAHIKVNKGKYLYNNIYTLLPKDGNNKIAEGFKFQSFASSLTLNYLFNKIDISLNFKGTILEYNPKLPYIHGAIFKYRDEIVQTTKDIDIGKIENNYIKINKHDGMLDNIPKAPFHSIESLEKNAFEGNDRYQIYKNHDELVTTKYINDFSTQYLVKDYLNNSKIATHKDDLFHIHLYNDEFFREENIGGIFDAFNFNFYKKYIFIANEQTTVQIIKRNIFKDFPINAEIRFGYSSFESWKKRDALIGTFDPYIYRYEKKVEIIQISLTQFIINGIKLYKNVPIYNSSVDNRYTAKETLYTRPEIMTNTIKVVTKNPQNAVYSYYTVPAEYATSETKMIKWQKHHEAEGYMKKHKLHSKSYIETKSAWTETKILPEGTMPSYPSNELPSHYNPFFMKAWYQAGVTTTSQNVLVRESYSSRYVSQKAVAEEAHYIRSYVAGSISPAYYTENYVPDPIKIDESDLESMWEPKIRE